MTNATRRRLFPAIGLPLAALALLAALAVLLTPGQAGAQSASRDATLSALTLSSGLSPSFEAGVTSYTSAVRNSTTRVTVTPTRNDSNATLSYNSTDAHADSGHQVDLAEGENTIVVTVTAADGVTMKEYMIRVWRHPDAGTLVHHKATGSASTTTLIGTRSSNAHQDFTTGPSRYGYNLNAVRIRINQIPSGTINWQVTIRRPSDNRFIASFNVFGISTGGYHTVPAVRPIHLEPNTDYRIMVWKNSGLWQLRTYPATSSGAGSNSLPGWTMENEYCRGNGRGCTERIQDRMLDLTLYGSEVDSTDPVLSSAIYQGDTITLTYDDLLDEGSTPATSAFTVDDGNNPVTVNSVAVSGREVVLTLASSPSGSNRVRVAYTVPGSNKIRNTGQRNAAALANQTVTAVHTKKLKSLTVGGIMVDGFDPDTREYTVNLPYERRGSINVTATAQHGDSYTKMRTNGNSWNGGHREPATGYERLELGANEVKIRVYEQCCRMPLGTPTYYTLTINRAEPPSRFGPFVDNLPKGRHAGSLVVNADNCLDLTGYSSACAAPLTRSERANTQNLAIKISVWPPESQGSMRGYRILRTRYEDGSAPSFRGLPYDTTERDDMIAGAGAITTLLPYTSTWIAHHDADIEHGYCYVYAVQAVGGTTANPVYAGAFNWVDAGTLSLTPKWYWELRPECIPSYTGSSAPEDAPSAPQNLAATAGTDSIALTWDATAGADSYTVLRRLQDLETYTEVGTSETNSYTDTSAEVAVGYAYQVKAVNESGSSESSEHVLAMIEPPPPDAPTGLEAEVGEDSVTLSWDASDDDTITSYMITRDVRGAGPPQTVLLRRKSGETHQVTDSSPEAGAAYTYSVMAINAGGRSEAATVDVDIPANTGGLTVTRSGATFNLAWDEVEDATGYNVLRMAPGESEHSQLASTETNSHADIPTGSGTFSYRIQPVEGETAGDAFAAVSAEMPPPPDPPTNLQAAATSSSVVLTWTAPEQTLLTYLLSRKLRDADPPEDFAYLGAPAGDATSYTDSTVEADTAYVYQLVAVGAEFQSDPVEVEAATPTAGPFAGFSLVDASDQSVLATLTAGLSVALANPGGGSYGIRAVLADGQTVGSVKLALTGAKTVTRTESFAPYTLYGDSYEGDASDIYGRSLPVGSYTLTATAYAEHGLAGDELGSLAVSFTVTQANRAPQFGSSTYSFSIGESVAVGATVGSVSATDADNDGLTYTIESGNAGGKFAIDGSSGAITTAGALDHATTPSYTLTVQADDGNGGTATATVNVGLTVDADAIRTGAVSLGAQSPDDGRQYFRNKSLERARGDGVDYYSFTTDGRYSLGLGVRDQSIELKVVLEDSNGDEVAVAGPPLNPNLDQVYLEWLKITIDAGTYYIRVEALEDSQTDYYIRFGLSTP